MAATRPAKVMLTLIAVAAALGGACSPTTRYRVLRFFFDGVPEPGAAPRQPGYPAGLNVPAGDGTPQQADRWPTGQTVYAHAPYRDNRCGVCHDPQTGELFRTARQGLCRNCHPDVPGPVPYVHGPVAVSDCLFCHHPHNAVYPKLLLTETTALCFRCHERNDLSTDAHPDDVLERACTACHQPHGGENRFFLKRAEP